MPEFPQPASSVIASQVHGDLEQPNAHARLTPKGSAPLIGLQEALLGQCLRGVGVSEHAEQNSVDTLLVRPNKWRKVIQCSHPEARFLLNGNHNRGSFILHRVRSLFHQDESGMERFTQGFGAIVIRRVALAFRPALDNPMLQGADVLDKSP